MIGTNEALSYLDKCDRKTRRQERLSKQASFRRKNEKRRHQQQLQKEVHSNISNCMLT